MIDAVVGGHLCLDIIPQFLRALGDEISAYVSPGRLVELGEAAISTGGAVSNTGINLHRLGVRTQLMGKVGDDLFGQAMVDIVRGHGGGLAEGMVVVPDEVSSYTVVVNPPGVDRAFLHCPGANHTFGSEDVRYDLLAEARLFHFGYPPLMRRMYSDGGGELADLMRRAKATGVTTSLDLTLPELAGPSGAVDWDAILARTLPYVDLFVPSLEEALFMLDRARFLEFDGEVGAAGMLEAIPSEIVANLADKALSYGAKIVVLKMGTRGIYARSAKDPRNLGRGAPPELGSWRGRELWARPFRPRRVAGTVGAGDAAIAGFLAAWLRGETLSEALNLSAAAGASCVEEPGAINGVRSWGETVARIQAGWERLSDEPPGPGWMLDEGPGIWRGPMDRPHE